MGAAADDDNDDDEEGEVVDGDEDEVGDVEIRAMVIGTAGKEGKEGTK